MINAEATRERAIGELQEICSSEINHRSTFGQESLLQICATLGTPCEISSNVLDEIPKDDRTYQSIGETPIPHRRISGLFLLEYRTFTGARSFQPCSKNIDLSGIFDVLHPLDHNGDPVFKIARTWSCIVQSFEVLPKEIRWVLATVYNFSNEMLRPEIDEPTLWAMRPWLMHWFDIADRLFELFNVSASTPTVNWFSRPRNDKEIGHGATDTANKNLRRRSSSLSSCGTVIHHEMPQHGHQSSPPDWPSRRLPMAAIRSWLNSTEGAASRAGDEVFDPTPGGSSRQRPSTQGYPYQHAPRYSASLDEAPPGFNDKLVTLL
ncbi:hypothetical protein HJFPF1_04867 [Paramyrothecium foliicola]|nr:hypothetical protein HJFPF1_04867 [Paramyrothecium foliicola]